MTRKIRTYKIMLVMSLIVPLCLFVIVMWQDYRNMMQKTEQEVVRTADIFQQHALEVFDINRLVCERVNERLRGMSWDEIGSSEAIQAYLKTISVNYPQVQAIWLADAAGVVRNASHPLPASPVSVADRDFFKALHNFDSGLFIGRIAKVQVLKGLNFKIALRRASTTGTFDGVVIVTVFQEYFSNFWNQFIQTKYTAAALIRDDGMILARAPRLDPELLQVPASASTMQAIRGRDRGSYYGISATDGLKRFFAFRKVGGYSAYLIFGIGTKAVLSEWQHHLILYGGIFGSATLALVLLSLSALKQARREQVAEQELSRAYDEMELRVQDRTAELNRANAELTGEISERKRTEEILNLQKVELEEEVTARQMAQENLQKKALLLEEEIEKRRQAQEELERLNTTLERRVKERTTELEEKNTELYKMNRLFVGRELRMMELKERIRALEEEAGSKNR